MNYFAAKLSSDKGMNEAWTEEELQIMQAHSLFYKDLFAKGICKVVGPVLDEDNGRYGFGIIACETIEEAREIVANDPANAIGSYHVAPMLAIFE